MLLSLARDPELVSPPLRWALQYSSAGMWCAKTETPSDWMSSAMLAAAIEAESLYRKTGTHLALGSVLLLQAEALRGLGQRDEALAKARTAREANAQLRERAVGDLDRVALAEAGGPLPADFLVGELSARPEGALEALSVSEDAHAPALRDRLALAFGSSERSTDAALDEEARSVRRALSAIDGRARDRDAERYALEQRLDWLEFRRLFGQPSPVIASTPLRAGELVALGGRLEPRWPVLMFHMTLRETTAFLLLPGRAQPIVRSIPLGAAAIMADVEALRHELADPKWEHRGARAVVASGAARTARRCARQDRAAVDRAPRSAAPPAIRGAGGRNRRAPWRALGDRLCAVPDDPRSLGAAAGRAAAGRSVLRGGGGRRARSPRERG